MHLQKTITLTIFDAGGLNVGWTKARADRINHIDTCPVARRWDRDPAANQGLNTLIHPLVRLCKLV